MKLKTVKNCYVEDCKRGLMVKREIGQEFDLDPAAEGETIYVLLQSGKITVIDEKFIPEDGKYIILRPFPYRTVEGFPRVGQPGTEISLSQQKGCDLLVSGFIKPVDPDGWTPRQLFGPMVKDSEIKRMFDDPLPAKEESWIGDWRTRREGR